MNCLLNRLYKGGGCSGTTGEDGLMPDVGQGIPAEVMTDVKERKLLTEFFSVGGIISSLLALGLVSIFERLRAGASMVNLPGVGRVPVTP